MVSRNEVALTTIASAAAFANGVSADGTIIVGLVTGIVNGGAVYWSGSGGIYADPVSLGALGGDTGSDAHGVSGDGLVIFGQSAGPGGNAQAFVWTAGGGMGPIAPSPDPPVDTTLTDAFLSTPTANLIFGVAKIADGTIIPCVWSGSGWSVITLLDIPAGAISVTLYGCTDSGNILIGSYIDVSAVFHGVTWTDGGGGFGSPVDLPLFDGNVVAPAGISADGTVMAGTAQDVDGNQHAVRWTSGTGWVPLGLPISGAFPMTAFCLSPDGNTIGGTTTEFGSNVFIWSVADGFNEILGAIGQPAWSSSDGSIVVGFGQTGPGSGVFWALLAPPAPSILSMDDVVVVSLATESPCTVQQFTTPPPVANSPSLGLRWSDTRGQTFGNAVAQQFSTDPLTSFQWNRTGYARDRVFELFWSAAFKTALNGAFVDVRTMKS